MENPEHPESKSPEPLNPPTLDYRGKGSALGERPAMRGAILSGFLCWVLCLFISLAAGQMSNSFWTGAGSLCGAIVLATLVVGRRIGLRGFIPGLLIGFSLTCLVPVGILEVICGGRHF